MKIASLSPHQSSRRIPPKNPAHTTIQWVLFPHLLTRICFCPHTLITHPYQKHTFFFIKSASNISLIIAKILYIQSINESSLLKRLCFNPHTTITHPYQKHELCFINPHQPSHSRWFTTKIMYLQKQNGSTLLISSLNYVTSLNTIITHPYPKSKDASFFAFTISPMSLHRISPVTFASVMSFLSTRKLKRKEETIYLTIIFKIRRD